jgi:hypothetical protein
MDTVSQPDTQELIELTAQGDAAAREQLLVRHRKRLLKMVAVRLDRAVAARLDPSDVVQEALAEAAQHLDEYLRTRPLPYYAWLRQFGWQRLVKSKPGQLKSISFHPIVLNFRTTPSGLPISADGISLEWRGPGSC